MHRQPRNLTLSGVRPLNAGLLSRFVGYNGPEIIDERRWLRTTRFPFQSPRRPSILSPSWGSTAQSERTLERSLLLSTCSTNSHRSCKMRFGPR
ncbi:unnamed protein product [Clonostachys chloroleuca]|uniref:Uncharacterized protein n=1 Tax=Clonostachys chloroleuca TaxID=1926264 RepID=A0AA35M6X9_9HYPO|nr:unnamed protein product [Clonostachys chloroleuca]